MPEKKLSVTLPELCFIMLTALVTMLVCTKSSPLYPTNDWLDANCYMTIGRGMTAGKMPYLDFFEHKGPLIFILHCIAALISHDSFMGVFLFEIAASICFLFLSYRIILDKTGKRMLWCVPFISMSVYSSYAFCHGDSAEEFCLPLLLFSYIISDKLLSYGKLLSGRDSFLIGIFSGLILWTKFNLLGFYAGLFIVMAYTYISQKKAANLVRCCGMTVLGVTAVSLPIIIFFAYKNALRSMNEVYFYDNIFVYNGSSSSVPENLANGFVFCYTFLPIGFAVIYLGIAAGLRQKNFRQTICQVTILLSMFIFTFAGHLSFQYYPLILAALIPVFLCNILTLLKSSHIKSGAFSAAVSLIICSPLNYFLSPNTYLMKYSRSDMPQFKFAETARKLDATTMLNYGFLDGGFYFAADIVPDYKYFCRNNTGMEEMLKSQDYYIQSGSPELIVSRSYTGERDYFQNYTCVSEELFPYYRRMVRYYLYVRNDIYEKYYC